MDTEKTQMGLPPITIGGQQYRVGRILRFVIGLWVILHACVAGPYDILHVFGAKLLVGVLLVDPALLKDVTTFWKSRNG